MKGPAVDQTLDWRLSEAIADVRPSESAEIRARSSKGAVRRMHLKLRGKPFSRSQLSCQARQAATADVGIGSRDQSRDPERWEVVEDRSDAATASVLADAANALRVALTVAARGSNSRAVGRTGCLRAHR